MGHQDSRGSNHGYRPGALLQVSYLCACVRSCVRVWGLPDLDGLCIVCTHMFIGYKIWIKVYVSQLKEDVRTKGHKLKSVNEQCTESIRSHRGR